MHSLLVLAGLLLVAGYSVSADPGCSSGSILNPFKRTCVRLLTDKKSWQDAKTYCKSHGENLASFNDVDSISWFSNAVRTTPAWHTDRDMWTAGKRIGQDWFWDGMEYAELRASNWIDIEPQNENNECIRFMVEKNDLTYIHRSFRWAGYSCDTKFYFVCEKASSTNSIHTGASFDHTPTTFDVSSVNSIVIKVKSSNDAIIGLQKTVGGDSNAVNEIVIGGWQNTKAVIRRVGGGDHEVEVNRYSGYLTNDYYRTFWISWANGYVNIGDGDKVGRDKFLSWKRTDDYTVLGISITGFDAEGDWFFPDM